jgi:hypothetical protein
MSIFYYVGDAGPVPADVTAEDGVTPVTPISATATIVNLHTGEVIVEDGGCQVGLGVAAYIIPDNSPITATSGRYVAYIRVVLDATTINTVAVPFDILDKASYMPVDRWRRKVEFAAPNYEAISDEEARDWIDQAVAYLNGRYDTGYTSVLAVLTPNDTITPASAQFVEMVASVASLMARTAWYAGKGNWRDEEMSIDTSPFAAEWKRLDAAIDKYSETGWFTFTLAEQYDMYNRDKADQWGIVDDPDDYYDARWARDPAPDTNSWYV